MGQLDKLETMLDEKLNKKASLKLPVESRKTIATNMWWVALVIGIFQLWAAWGLWHIGHRVDSLVDRVNAAYGVYGGVVNDLGMFYYISVLLLVADAALLLLAAPALKEMRKAGWNLLFYGLILNVGYGLVRMFADYGGMSDLLWAFVASFIGAFFLFQVRDHFIMSKSGHKADKPAADSKK
jgi:hypothetical protein